MSVEASAVMLAQRLPGAALAVQAATGALPFSDETFSGAMGILTVHHWSEQARRRSCR